LIGRTDRQGRSAGRTDGCLKQTGRRAEHEAGQTGQTPQSPRDGWMSRQTDRHTEHEDKQHRNELCRQLAALARDDLLQLMLQLRIDLLLSTAGSQGLGFGFRVSRQAVRV
jgi:hypothetical protein